MAMWLHLLMEQMPHLHAFLLLLLKYKKNNGLWFNVREGVLDHTVKTNNTLDVPMSFVYVVVRYDSTVDSKDACKIYV